MCVQYIAKSHLHTVSCFTPNAATLFVRYFPFLFLFHLTPPAASNLPARIIKFLQLSAPPSIHLPQHVSDGGVPGGGGEFYTGLYCSESIPT